MTVLEVKGKESHKHMSSEWKRLLEERLYRQQHLAAVFRIFAERGFDEDVVGHVSVRDAVLTDHFCDLLFGPLSQLQLLITAAEQDSGHTKKIVDDEEAPSPTTRWVRPRRAGCRFSRNTTSSGPRATGGF